MSVASIAERLRASRGFAHKNDISDVVALLSANMPGGRDDLALAVAVGDDCAAIPDGDGYLLFAIEGLVSDFVSTMPWFAGYSGVMVNVSDVYAMGGRPIAVVDALWSRGIEGANEVIAGMAAASVAYGVPLIGGHSNTRSEEAQLAVAILGRAKKLLTSFNARPGDRLLMVADLRGGFEDPYPFWNASVKAPPNRLRGDLEVLPELAESGMCDAAKDISMAGALGTAMMLLECSSVGATIDLNFTPGTHYPVRDFVSRSKEALNIASERVREKYGFAWSAAMDQLAQIEELAERFTDDSATVTVLELR
ncbi:MAG: uncharacterized protein QOF46_1720 [Paraburkholderia sp.]|nr:uncharacterized protein [Paraburkholderia sp.]